MSLFGKAARRISPGERRASPSDPIAAWAADVEFNARTSTAAGRSVTSETARLMAAVLAAQSLIADGVASLPIEVFRDGPNGRRVRVDPPGWLTKPNEFDRQYDFIHKVMISLVGEASTTGCGGAAIHVQRREDGTPVGLLPLDPSIVMVDEKSAAPRYWIAGTPFSDREILFIPAFTRPGVRRGMTVLEYAREAVGIGLAAEEHAARLFSQGTAMSGVIEHPGEPSNGELAKLARMLKKSHGGLRNSHGIGVLSGGATWKQVTMTAEQAQFLESRRYQALQIAQIYRVPPNFLDPTVQSSWGTGVAEQNRFFVDYTLVPWLRRVEDALSTLLPNKQFVRFNVDARLRGTPEQRAKVNAELINSGQRSLDEIRALDGLDPLPGGLGKKHFVSTSVTELTNEKPPPPRQQDEVNDDGNGAADAPE